MLSGHGVDILVSGDDGVTILLFRRRFSGT
jgi:hypothetical protein